MALTERNENDKIEVVGQYKTVQVRRATVIERDGVELTRTFHRHVLQPGTVAEGTSKLIQIFLVKMLMFKPSAMLHGLMQLKSHIASNL